MIHINYGITATYSEPVQVGVSEFKQVYTSRNFGKDSTLGDLLDWAATLQNDGLVDINSVTLSATDTLDTQDSGESDG